MQIITKLEILKFDSPLMTRIMRNILSNLYPVVSRMKKIENTIRSLYANQLCIALHFI